MSNQTNNGEGSADTTGALENIPFKLLLDRRF